MARGIALTAAGRVFLDHARLALLQVEAAAEAARRAEQPQKLRILREEARMSNSRSPVSPHPSSPLR
jgi:DNA-binding transcriptional LysR family regulator